MRIEALAASKGVPIRWRPFLLGAIFKSFGWTSSPFVLQKAKGEYVWHDMLRQCRKYDLPWVKPSVFPRISLLSMRVAMVGAEEPWIGDYCKQIMLMNFARDREIDTPEAVSEVLQQLGLPAEDILAKARSEDNKLRLRAQTEEAQARGIFGAPTFFVGSEMFWGDDRLDDALALAEGS